MLISEVSLEGFRSYRNANFKLHPELNIVCGKNGSGKTNLLEAIYVLATTKSWRAKDQNLINNKSSYYKISASFDQAQAEIRYQRGKPRQILLNGKPQKPEEFIGTLPMVLFEPGSLALIEGQPESRRRFINAVLSTVDNSYLRELLQYRRVLRQRNALLRGSRSNLIDEVFAWDIKMVELASQIVAKRMEAVEYFNKFLPGLYNKISKQKIKISITYQSSISLNDYSANLLRQLNNNLHKDQALGFTSCGPHRDELKIEFAEKPAAANASRGEARSIALALKMLERQYIHEQIGSEPTLLLDDVLSELDQFRRRFLLSNLSGSQTIITTTDIAGIKTKLPKKYKIINL